MSTDVASYRCDESEARDLTEQIKGSVERVYLLLLRAREGRAHLALGYATWEAYVRAEFDMSRQQSYRLLDQGEVIREITAAAGVSPMGDITERETRDLKPHLAEVADAVREAVADVPEADRPAAAAQAVKDARARLTTTTRTTEATKLEQNVDLTTGEITPPGPGAASPEAAAGSHPAAAPELDPLASARAEVARQPVIVAGKAIDRLRTARLTFEAAGTPAEIVADLEHTLPDLDSTGFWLSEIEAVLPVLNGLAVALRRRNLRSVKP